MPQRSKRELVRNFQRARTIQGHSSLVLLAGVVGILGGLGAVVFHTLLYKVSHGVLHTFAELHLQPDEASFPRSLFFLIPALGGLVSGFLVYKFAPEAEGHGTDAMINTFHNKGGRVRKRVPLIKALSSLATIATGGSAGYEGPVAQIGSGLGSILTRYFRMSIRNRRIMLLAGTSAGLGAIFKAPLGGALTSVEILYKEDFESDAFMTSIVASVVAYAVYTAFVGTSPVFGVLPNFYFNNGWELIGYIMLGALCAPASWLYIKIFYSMRNVFRGMRIPRMFKPAIGGLGIGALFYIRPEILGGGWDYLIQAMDGTLASSYGGGIIRIMLMIALFKMVATAFTVGSGGSGGVFGPSLFIGGMFGGAVGLGLHEFFPSIVSQPEAYVLVGMGTFFAGAANAPVAATVMVCEMTGTYTLLAPLMLSSVVHILLARNWSIYERQVPNKFHSPAHRSEMNVDVLQSIRVREFVKGTLLPVRIAAKATLKEVETYLAKNADEDVFLVTDDEKVVGLVDVHAIRKAIFDPTVATLIIVEDMMFAPHFLSEEMNLHSALQVFLKHGVSQLPVRNRNGEITAMLRHRDIIHAYDEAVRKQFRKS